MAHLATSPSFINVSGWWTDDRVRDTVTSRYVHSHLRPNEAEQLTTSVFGDLSDDTYLEWILTRAKRFFLALLDAGVPDQIFGIIDDSYDDEDLPISEDDVPALRLSLEPDRALDRCFYKAQFKYLIRIVGEGEHIRYADEETLPIVTLNSKPTVLNSSTRDQLDRITLPSDSRRVFWRKRIRLVHRSSEDEALAEIIDCKRFAHEHIISVFGSYTSGDDLFVLLTPGPGHTLKSFLSDPPASFEGVPKAERSKILITWTSCLANGLAWLHANGRHHGCIRPSRIQVDERLQISLSQLDGDGVLGSSTVKDDIEAYQYAAPERWKRSVTVQSTGSRMSLPSGGRTGRKMTMGGGDSPTAPANSNDGSGRHRLETMKPTSTSYAFLPTSKGNSSRLRLGMTSTVKTTYSPPERPVESRMSHRTVRSPTTGRDSEDDDYNVRSLSKSSSGSSGSGRMSRGGMHPIYVAAPELRTAVVQTWASAQHDMLAADIFAMGTVIMDILTVLCKHGYSAFARHRSSKNRVAGRGGGLADASFHANLVQVGAWAQMLQKDAEKRIKKNDGAVFKAVGPILQIIMQCLEREPSYRQSAEDLAKKLEEHIRDFADIRDPHCTLDLTAREPPQTADEVRIVPAARAVSRKTRTEEQAKKAAEIPLPPNCQSYLEAPTPTPIADRPASRQARFFNFDFDARSETVVDDRSTETSSTLQNSVSTASGGDISADTERRLIQAIRNMSVRPKHVSWIVPEEEEQQPYNQSESNGPPHHNEPGSPISTAGPFSSSKNHDYHEPVSPISISSVSTAKKITSEWLRLHSSGDRTSFQFPAPPTPQPTYGLPAVPGKDTIDDLSSRTTSGRDRYARSGRA